MLIDPIDYLKNLSSFFFEMVARPTTGVSERMSSSHIYVGISRGFPVSIFLFRMILVVVYLTQFGLQQNMVSSS